MGVVADARGRVFLVVRLCGCGGDETNAWCAVFLTIRRG
jgi:hypothetical protein